MDYTQMLGNTNELKCITAFMQLGFECSIPYGNGAKYDFIADNGEHLYRIQCKSSSYVNDHGNIKEDAFCFNTVCQTTNTKETVRYTYSNKEIDYFATCFKGKVYVIPVEECKTSKTLRLEPPANGQTNYSKAEDYLINKVFTHTQKLKDSYIKYKNRIETQKKEHHYYCSICGKEIPTKGARCLECYHKSLRKVERPSKEELLQLVKENGMTKTGKMFEVSDKSISKWLIDYGLPGTIGELKEQNLI